METAYFKRPQGPGNFHYYKVFGGPGKTAHGYQEVVNFLGPEPMIAVEHNHPYDPKNPDEPFSLTGTWCTYEVGIPISKQEYREAYQRATAMEFIYVNSRTVHPDPKCQRNQRAYLDAALDEEVRKMLAFTFRTGNVTMHYCRSQQAEPTPEDYADWLEGLPETNRRYNARQGFEKSKTVLGLRRHAAERNDLGLDAYMKESVSPQDYAEWRKLGSS